MAAAMVLNGCDIWVLLNERERKSWAMEVSRRIKASAGIREELNG